jgi:hypothetical protein
MNDDILEENLEEYNEIEIADEEVNSLVNDTEQSKRQRIEIVNSWPTKNQFEIEKVFTQKLKTLNIQESFRPVHFNYSNEKYFQRSVAYILDSLDFLPNRPDLAFDFIWRAIDFLSRESVLEENIPFNNDKDILKASVDIVWTNYFDQNLNIKNNLLTLLQCVPVQSCEYLFKRIYSTYDDSKPNNPNKEVSRLIGFDGGSVRNTQAKQIIDLIKVKYPYSDTISRRKGSRFLYRYIKGDELSISAEDPTQTIKADFSQSLNFFINGILYTFRNDRAHGGVFSPFRSSKATMRTYAHCSFTFLLGYYLLVALIHKRDNSLISEESLQNNYNLNIELFKNLYGRNLKR